MVLSVALWAFGIGADTGFVLFAGGEDVDFI